MDANNYLKSKLATKLFGRVQLKYESIETDKSY